MDSESFARIGRIRQQLERKEPPSVDDIQYMVDRCWQVDKGILEAVDLLRQSRSAFRSKQVERARKILEELL